jgi:hypothetical protein
VENNQLKALLMAILSPQGHVMNLNDQNFKFMSTNADKILEICGIKKKEVSDGGTKEEK